MKNFPRFLLTFVSVTVGLVSGVATGQRGSVAFKHFKSYPPGQWTQQTQAYQNGTAMGPPQNSTSCASPLTASQAAGVTKLGNDAAPMCRTKILVDEERTAEYEQVCDLGPQQQVIRSTMRAVDDKTIAVEIRNTLGGHEMSVAKITSRYTGPCTAAPAMPGLANLPAIPKPSAEQCAELPTMKQQAEETAKNCSTPEFSESERASCRAAMQRVANHVRQMEAVCKQ